MPGRRRPRSCHARRRLIQGVQHGEAAVVEVAGAHAGGALAVHLRTARAVLAGEKAAREAEVGDAGQAEALADAGQIQLVVALHQVVVGLQGDIARIAPLLAQAQRLDEAPRAVVGGSHVAHDALVEQRPERLQRLLQRRVGVVLVGVVEVDAIGRPGARSESSIATRDGLRGEPVQLRATCLPWWR